MSLKVLFSLPSTDYPSAFSGTSLFLPYAPILVLSFCFFSLLIVSGLFSLFNLLCLTPSLQGKLLGKELWVFSGNSRDHCHKILKVEKNALAAQKETGSVSWCCSDCSSPTPWKLSVNHPLPSTHPPEAVCWGPGCRSVSSVCPASGWCDNSAACHLCATQMRINQAETNYWGLGTSLWLD